jgi:hypothetical protein
VAWRALKAIDPLRLVWLYLVVLGAGLVLDGSVLLVLDRFGVAVPVATGETRLNLLHVVWGLGLLGVSLFSRGQHAIRAVWAVLIFGTFYVALGVVGLTIDRPFGLQLGLGENIFHFTIGPVALVLGAWALRATSVAPVPLRSAARQAQSRNGQVNRRRARHRPGSGRGGRRRR